MAIFHKSEDAMSKRIITPGDEAARMVREGLASDVSEALRKLREFESQARISDLLILYTDITVVRGIFNENPFRKKLLDEQPYQGAVMAAFIPSGIFAHASLKKEPIIFGKITELVSKDGESAQLVAIAEGLKFNGRKSIFFSSKSAAEINARGSKTFNQIHPEMDLYRWEVSPEGDIVCAIFNAWNSHSVSADFSLVLYIPKNKVVMFP
jgi:hypothetical protein